jgi:hypothetical protein
MQEYGALALKGEKAMKFGDSDVVILTIYTIIG